MKQKHENVLNEESTKIKIMLYVIIFKKLMKNLNNLEFQSFSFNLKNFKGIFKNHKPLQC